MIASLFENSLVYLPTRYPQGNWNPPGLWFEDAQFQATDGTQLHGWYVPHPEPRAVVLFAHGNGGNLSGRADVLRLFHNDLKVSVLIFDYRGYGKSEGKPYERGVLSDARAARAWLAKRTGVSEQDIVLFGRSLGGAVAVDMAAHDGARGLILESTFTSLPEVAAVHYPWLPTRWLMSNRFDSEAIIADYPGPLLQSHGTADTVVPFELGRRLFESAQGKKEFHEIPHGDHNELPGREYYLQLDAFLNKL